MELRQLKNFYETAKLGNMTKASKVINISQPALSISISKLEDELGIKLFDRDYHTIRLSKAGRALLAPVEKMLSCEDEILSACRELKTGVHELKIKMDAAQPFVIDVISRFHHEHPDVRIQMVHDENIDGMAGIIISAFAERPKTTDCSHSPIIFEENLLVAVPRILNPVCESPITLDYLLENELIGLSKKYSLGIIEEYYCKLYNLNLNHSITCDNPSVMRNLLINGTGLAFVPSKTWMLQSNPALNLIPFEIPNWMRYILIQPTGYSSSKDISDSFMKYLSDGLSKL